MNQVNKKDSQDFIALYDKYQSLSPGRQSELKRVAEPCDLVEVPAFYSITKGFGTDEKAQRLVYCLPCINHKDGGRGLGKALADAGINEKRLFIVVRSYDPNDIIQLRRLLQQVKPTIDWLITAKQLYYWNDLSKRTLLEDFFLHQKQSD